MQVTKNVVSLPSIVVDAYLDMLAKSVDPILSEEGLSSKVQDGLLSAAYYACTKSVCMKFMPEIEEAGLFNVICLDNPAFKWNRGNKFVYAAGNIVACLVRTMAEEMAHSNRDVTAFMDFLEAWDAINIDKNTAELLEHAEGLAGKRLEEHALGLAKANSNLMVGETQHQILQLLRNVKNGLDTLDADMEYLVPEQTVYL